MKIFFLLFLSLSLSCFGEKIRVACVGDSITFGATINNRQAMSYPSQLGRLLGSGYQVKNFGVNGATMLKKGDRPYWKTPAFTQAKEFQPDIVIIKLGTNDSKPKNWKYARNFARDYRSFIKVFSELDSKPKIYICRPIPCYPGNSVITDEVVRREVIPEVNKVAKDSDVVLIDLYCAMLWKDELVPDKVHPNAKGAGVIAKTVAEALVEE